MERTEERSRRWPGIAMPIVLAAVVGALFFASPFLRRPLEILAGAGALLAFLSALTVRQAWFRNALLLAASLAFACFAVEMAEKFFHVTRILSPRQQPRALGEGGGYSWDVAEPAGYFAARDRALADGVRLDPPEGPRVGDPFMGADPDELVTTGRDVGVVRATSVALKRFYLVNTPLGYELNPGNRVHDFACEPESGRYYFDALYTTIPRGFRYTRGNPESSDIHLFYGDSFTFGVFLNDDETLPHYFSEAADFDENILNLGVMGWGPHQSLRAMETGRFLPEPPPGARVRGVYFGLIDHHVDRVINPSRKYMSEPSYVLEEGRARYRDRSNVRGLATVAGDILNKSRFFSVLRDRLSARSRDGEDGWRLVTAILAEMDRLSRERYGVPLTVIYWDAREDVVPMLTRAGLDAFRVGEAFPEGEGWRALSIRYLVFDGHPSAAANRELARHLRARGVWAEGKGGKGEAGR